MAVPEYIRMVPRPVNTIVEDNGRDGPNRFAVRERVSIKYISGGNPQPKNGKVIGHIRDGKYVPKQDKASVSGPDMLSYGASAFVKSVSEDLLDDLLEVVPHQRGIYYNGYRHLANHKAIHREWQAFDRI